MNKRAARVLECYEARLPHENLLIALHKLSHQYKLSGKPVSTAILGCRLKNCLFACRVFFYSGGYPQEMNPFIRFDYMTKQTELGTTPEERAAS